MVKREDHGISGLFVFLLLGVFGMLSVLMVLFGAQVYRGIVERSEAHGEARVLPAVVRGMVRSGDSAGADNSVAPPVRSTERWAHSLSSSWGSSARRSSSLSAKNRCRG